MFDQRARKTSMRRILLLAAGVSSLLAMGVCGSLVILTSIVQESTWIAEQSGSSVRFAAEAQVDLLLLARVQDPAVRSEIAGELRQKLIRAQQYVTDSEEQRLLDIAQRKVAALTVNGGGITTELESTYAALDDVLKANLRQASEARERLEAWSAWSSSIALVTGTFVLSISAFLGWWLLRRALHPILDLSSTMDATAWVSSTFVLPSLGQRNFATWRAASTAWLTILRGSASGRASLLPAWHMNCGILFRSCSSPAI